MTPDVGTQAVVLAAGKGSRLGHSSAKPLYPLFGVPLLARTLFTLQEAGVTRAHVVIGHNGDLVRKGIESIDRLTLPVHWIENHEWEQPNGVSVLAAKEHVSGPFLLTMSDHVFDPGIASRLLERRGSVEGLLLAVDRELGGVNDLDDATKVRLEGDSIVEIGKELSDFDAIDTGVFLATPALFDALERAGEAPSLSQGVAALAAEGRARTVDVSDLPWQDVDTPDDVRAAERKLLRRWPKPTDGPVSRLINRPISTRISRLLAPLQVTPNQVSLLTLIMGIATGVFGALGGYWNWVWAGLLFQVASILDGTDGELAVLTFRKTPQGAWIDTACDNVTYVAFLGGLIYGVVRAGLPPIYFWSGIAGFVATVVSLANINMYLVREGTGSALTVEYHYQKGESRVAWLWHFMHWFGKRDLLAFIAFGMALIGQLPLALPLFGIGATIFLLPATTRANIAAHRARRRLVAAEGAGED